MFRPSRGSDQSKIRLPKQTNAPGVKELTSLYEQARENRAREVELVWQVPNSSMSYSIHVKFDRVTPHPIWNIWENNGQMCIRDRTTFAMCQGNGFKPKFQKTKAKCNASNGRIMTNELL